MGPDTPMINAITVHCDVQNGTIEASSSGEGMMRVLCSAIVLGNECHDAKNLE